MVCIRRRQAAKTHQNTSAQTLRGCVALDGGPASMHEPGAGWLRAGGSVGLSSDARLCCSAPQMTRMLRMLGPEAGHVQAVYQLAGGSQSQGAGHGGSARPRAIYFDSQGGRATSPISRVAQGDRLRRARWRARFWPVKKMSHIAHVALAGNATERQLRAHRTILRSSKSAASPARMGAARTWPARPRGHTATQATASAATPTPRPPAGGSRWPALAAPPRPGPARRRPPWRPRRPHTGPPATPAH
jgi:hypothetical protein